MNTAFLNDPCWDRCCSHCICPLAKLVSSFGVSYAQFADDTQLYIALEDDNSKTRLSECFRAVQHWLDLNGLSMDPGKTEAIVIGTSARKRMEGLVNTVDLGCVSVSPVSSVRSLGVTIDDTLSFDEHVNNVCKSCKFHIRALRHIRCHIPEDAAKTIACSMVNGRLDYCNCVLYHTSSANFNKLQQVRNSVARIITRRRPLDHITPVLQDHPWLPVQYRIQYKLAVTTFKVLTTQELSYRHDLVQSHSSTHHLRSDGRGLLQVDRVESAFAERVFRHSAPVVWNSLPQHLITNLSNFPNFKRHLKTELYRRAFLR
jgi:Reverse transcriptase (RNA-dependent DNA polymerase)